MCLVYVYNCRVCYNLFRNYKRWPVFCKKEYCVKLYDDQLWCNEFSCTGKPCHKEVCGIIQQKGRVCINCLRAQKKRIKSGQVIQLIREE